MQVIMSTKLIKINMVMLMVFLGFSRKKSKQKREAGVPIIKQRTERTPKNISTECTVSTEGTVSVVPFISSRNSLSQSNRLENCGNQ